MHSNDTCFVMLLIYMQKWCFHAGQYTQRKTSMNGQWIAYAYVSFLIKKIACKYACKTEKEIEYEKGRERINASDKLPFMW